MQYKLPVALYSVFKIANGDVLVCAVRHQDGPWPVQISGVIPFQVGHIRAVVRDGSFESYSGSAGYQTRFHRGFSPSTSQLHSTTP